MRQGVGVVSGARTTPSCLDGSPEPPGPGSVEGYRTPDHANCCGTFIMLALGGDAKLIVSVVTFQVETSVLFVQ